MSGLSPDPDLGRNVGPLMFPRGDSSHAGFQEVSRNPRRATAIDNSVGEKSCGDTSPSGEEEGFVSEVGSTVQKLKEVKPGILLVIQASWCQILAARAPVTLVGFHEDL